MKNNCYDCGKEEKLLYSIQRPSGRGLGHAICKACLDLHKKKRG
jgi:hypothetical protein